MKWNEGAGKDWALCLCLAFWGTVLTVLVTCAGYAVIGTYVGALSRVGLVVVGAFGALVGYGLMVGFAYRIAQLERQEFEEQFSQVVATAEKNG